MTVAGSFFVREGGDTGMEFFIGLFLSFLVSVAAGIAANILYGIICKWLNGRRK